MKLFLFTTFLLVFLDAHAAYKVYSLDAKFPQQKLFDYQKMQAPVAADDNGVLDDSAGDISGAAVTVSSFLAQPDMARNIVVTPGGTTADVAAGNVVVTGTDIRGKVISESFAFLANASTAVVGVKAFRTVTSIVFPIEDSPYGATWDVGWGDKLGLNRCLDGSGWFIKGMVDDVALTGATVVADASVISSNTMTPNPVADGSRVFELLYVQNYRCD